MHRFQVPVTEQMWHKLHDIHEYTRPTYYYAITPFGKLWKAVCTCTWPQLTHLVLNYICLWYTWNVTQYGTSENDKERESQVDQGTRVGDQTTKILRLWRKKRDEIRRCPCTPWHGHCSKDVPQYAPARKHTPACWSYTKKEVPN